MSRDSGPNVFQRGVMALILLPLGDGVEGLLEKRAVRKNKRRRSGDVARRDQFNRWDRGGNSYF